jgi:hypothetical protein
MLSGRAAKLRPKPTSVSATTTSTEGTIRRRGTRLAIQPNTGITTTVVMNVPVNSQGRFSTPLVTPIVSRTGRNTAYPVNKRKSIRKPPSTAPPSPGCTPRMRVMKRLMDHVNDATSSFW